MRTLEDIIVGRTLHMIGRAASVRDAAELMASRRVSALPVVEGDLLAGIVTERDLVHRVLAVGADPATTAVAQIMTTTLVTARPGESYEQAQGRMKRNHVRHLLVVAGGRLQGLVSMRDLLVVDAAEKSEEIELLTAYIYAVPPVLPPLGPVDDDWAHTL
jgi:CBS domain-containing protein